MVILYGLLAFSSNTCSVVKATSYIPNSSISPSHACPASSPRFVPIKLLFSFKSVADPVPDDTFTPSTYNVNPDLIEEKITERTKAIIPVHTFGQPAEIGKIMEIAKDNNLQVIEDTACALGAKYKGRYAGTIGDIGCFSFHARKGITTGEGGMAVTNNKNLADKIRKLSVFGMTPAWEREKTDKFFIPEFVELGFNYKMSDITAAVGVAQLRKLKNIIKRKKPKKIIELIIDVKKSGELIPIIPKVGQSGPITRKRI